MKKLLFFSLILINVTSLLQAAHLRQAAVKCAAVSNLSVRGLRSSAHRKPISTPFVNVQTLLKRIEEERSESIKREADFIFKHQNPRDYDAISCRKSEENLTRSILSVLYDVFSNNLKHKKNTSK